MCRRSTCSHSSNRCALLRREGLYTSHVAAWRRAARRGELAGLAQRRGPKPTPPDPHVKQIATLERQLARVTARAERLELIVELQKKVAQLLGLALPASGEHEQHPPVDGTILASPRAAPARALPPPHQSCSRPRQISCGVGTLRNSKARPRGRGCIST